MAEAKTIKIHILEKGYLISTSIINTEKAYAVENEESLIKTIKEIING